MKAFIKRAFPVPRLLVSPQVSVEISDDMIRYFEFSRSRGHLRPKVFGTEPFPPIRMNSLTDKAKADATEALIKFKEQKGYDSVRVIVHEGEAYAFRTTIPTVEKTEARAAIEATLEENVPIPPSEAVFEYDFVRVDKAKGESVVSVTALPRKTLDRYIEIFTEAGISPVSFQTEARALSKALFPKGDNTVHAVLSIKNKHSTVFIVQNGSVSFSAYIEVGSSDIDSAIAKTYDISEEEARKMKEEKAFLSDSDDTKLFDAMIPVFSTIRDELLKVLLYWKTLEKKESEFVDVSDIVLAGGDALVSGFASYISLTSKLPAKTGSVWTRVLSPGELVPDLSYRESLDYGAVIGILL